MAITESPNFDIKTFTDYSTTEPRDPQSGRLLKHLTQRQLDAVLARYPHLKAVAPTLPNPNARPEWREPHMVFNGARAHAIEDAARWSPLLRDPVQQVRKISPTKPEHRDSGRALAVAYHEAGHSALALMLGQRVLSATIRAEGTSDGHTMLQNSGDVGVDCCMDLAGQVADELSGVPMGPTNYFTDNQRWPAEMRAEMKPLVHRYLTEGWGAVDEIAKQLLLNETLDEFKIKLAYVRGLQKMRASVSRSISEPTQKKAKAAPKQRRVVREYDFSKQADIHDWNKRMGNENVDAEPIGFGVGHIVPGSYR
jgi:hypothetical protein